MTPCGVVVCFFYLKDVKDMKPVIGVMPLWDDDKNSIWMLPGYLEGIKHAGGVPIILPMTTDKDDLSQIIGMCDGYLFTGGHDVSPEIYHEKPISQSVICCKERDEMESVILESAINSDKPVLGICRGIQFINAVLGGTLYQDIPTQHPSEIEHHQSPPYDVPVHKVTIVRDSPLYDCLKAEEISVNSYHHQAIKDLAPGLSVMAVSPDGLTEAICMPEHRFLWAVQWHPEFSYKTDSNSQKIFNVFVKAAI